MKLALAFVLLAACATVPPTPAQTLPPVAPPAAPHGRGVLIVDVTDGPSDVEYKGESCTTPCALMLPLGSQPITLHYHDQQGVEHVDTTQPLILPEPQVLRRTLQRVVITHPVRRRIALALFYGSYAVLAAGVVAWSVIGESDSARVASWSLAGVGGGMFVLSIPIGAGAAYRIAGSETQFPWPRN